MLVGILLMTQSDNHVKAECPKYNLILGAYLLLNFNEMIIFKILSIPNMYLFFLQLFQQLWIYYHFCVLSLNSNCQTYLGTMWPPGGRNWQLINFYGTTCFEKNVKKCLKTNIYFYLETSGGQSSNLNLNVVHFSTPVLIRHLCQFKTAVFLPWCLICSETVFLVVCIPSMNKL